MTALLAALALTLTARAGRPATLEAAPSRGARVRVEGEAGWVQLDGRDAGTVGFARFLNVQPGSHALRISRDLVGKELICKGRVEAHNGEVAVVRVDPEGDCTGFVQEDR